MNSRISYFSLFISSVLVFIVTSCANIGRPGGGPIDLTPPVLLKSTPEQGATFFKKKKIELEFDEIIQVEKPGEKITVSPPQTNPPEIYTAGKKIIVELKDSLRNNTTYTVDFSDAIVDNNEKNPYPNFALSFSTGGSIDSMEVGGVLLNAEDLEPVTGMYVGLQPDLADSAFRKKSFVKITRSDASGNFTLKNVASGKYRIYALKDANRDYKFDQPGEDIAFLDSVIVPSYKLVEKTDTIWKDKLKHKMDTVRTVKVKQYLPNNLLLRAFNENFKSQYLDKTERKERNHLLITFAAPAKELPRLRPLNFPAKNWARLERSATNDTLNFWIKDSTIYKNDTLRLEASYLHTDSLRRLVPQTDTLTFTFHDIKLAPSKKSKKKDENAKVEKSSLQVESKFGGSMDLYGLMDFSLPVPIDSIDEKRFHFEEKKDSLWHTLNTPPFTYDSLNIRKFNLKYKWVPGQEYRLKVDSAAIYGMNGLCNKPFEKSFKVKNVEDYSGFFINVVGVTDSAFVELLNESDKMVRREPVIKGVAEFFYVNPGTYYARLILDKNKNGKWDTGNFGQKLQPEQVYYHPGKFQLRTNWDVEEQGWNPLALPLDKQKPRKLVKNKPKEKVKRDPITGKVIPSTPVKESTEDDQQSPVTE
jgi:hypothetical protein